ncbi:MAG: zf-HC2 domain-containing protein [bacterium]
MSGEEITCRELVNRLSLYIDGELRPRMLREVERHLERCGECSHCADEIRATIRLIHERAYEPLPSSERERMRTRLWRSLALGTGE